MKEITEVTDAPSGKLQVKVFVADDHKIVIEGLKALLESEFQIVGTAADGREAVEAVQRAEPDVAILDISMPQLNGIDAARAIRKSSPKVKIVMLSMHADPEYVEEAFGAGASAFVTKHSAGVDLKVAIREVLRGRSYVTPQIAVGENRIAHQLTARQREVLQLLAEGRSAKEAGSILNVSPRTIEFHKYRMMELLGLKTIAQLTHYAIKRRIVSE